MHRKYKLETYGCQMNTAESNAMEIHLKTRGWISTSDQKNADLIILNTCSVRKSAENRIVGRIGFYKKEKENHPFSLAVIGCMAERLKNRLKKEYPAVDIAAGNFSKGEFISFLKNIEGKADSGELFSSETYQFAKIHLKEDEFRAVLPIMHGCNNFCTYCIVPYVRGREVSRDPVEIIEEIQLLEEKGVKEITLLGQNVNSYNYSSSKGKNKLDFADLLDEIAKKVKSIKWIRFLSSHPKDFSDKLIDVIQLHNTVCKHIHLPVQHGSDNVLSGMNRQYTKDGYMKLVSKLRNKIPDLSLTTDLLIGFPGETEEDANDLKLLLKEVMFDDAFTYHYNPRKGTKAFDFPGVIPDEVKQDRLLEVIEMQREISRMIKLGRVGGSRTVLVESISKKNELEVLGRTERNEMAVFPGSRKMIGKFFNIKLISLNGNTYKGELI